MILRSATLADLALLRRWDAQPHVAAASGDDDWFDWAEELPRRVPWRELLIAGSAGRPIGFLQIIDPAEEETHYWGDVAPQLRAIDIWIGDAADLGRGHGTRMMRAALARCFADPRVTAVLIDPLARNVRACRFYERLGFRPVERRTFGTDDCIVYRLERDAWQTVATERLVLRRFRSADAVALHRIFGDREAMRFWSTPPHATLAETEQFVARTIAAQEAGTADEFVVEHDGRIIGKAGVWRGNEVGFIFAPDSWGRGFAAEALRALLAHCGQRGFSVMRADVDPRNARSLRLLERLGFRVVGSAKRTFLIDNEWADSVYLEVALRQRSG